MAFKATRLGENTEDIRRLRTDEAKGFPPFRDWRDEPQKEKIVMEEEKRENAAP